MGNSLHESVSLKMCDFIANDYGRALAMVCGLVSTLHILKEKMNYAENPQ